MKNAIALMSVAAVFLSACGDAVPHVEDPHHPVDASGNPLKSGEFLQKYCQGKPTNETCVKVLTAANMDASRGGLPKGW